MSFTASKWPQNRRSKKWFRSTLEFEIGQDNHFFEWRCAKIRKYSVLVTRNEPPMNPRVAERIKYINIHRKYDQKSRVSGKIPSDTLNHSKISSDTPVASENAIGLCDFQVS